MSKELVINIKNGEENIIALYYYCNRSSTKECLLMARSLINYIKNNQNCSVISSVLKFAEINHDLDGIDGHSKLKTYAFDEKELKEAKKKSKKMMLKNFEGRIRVFVSKDGIEKAIHSTKNRVDIDFLNQTIRNHCVIKVGSEEVYRQSPSRIRQKTDVSKIPNTNIDIENLKFNEINTAIEFISANREWKHNNVIYEKIPNTCRIKYI